MKRTPPLFLIVLPLLLLVLLSGCSLTEIVDKGTQIFDNMTSLPRGTPAPTAAPATPTPTPLPGAAGEAQKFLEALRGEDRAVVRAYAGDSVPGFNNAVAPSSSALLTLYGSVYEHLTWRFGTVSEGVEKASVVAELTTLDMREVMAALQAELEVFVGSAEYAALGGEARRSEYDALLYKALGEAETTVTKKATIALHKENGRWYIDVGSELKAALTGALTTVLPDFDLPEPAAEGALTDTERQTEIYLMGSEEGSVVIRRILPAAPEGYTLEVEIHNAAWNERVFSLRGCTVNGYVLDPLWYALVPGGATVASSIVWDRNAMLRCGITSVGNISCILDVYEKQSWPVYPVSSRYCSVQPNGQGGESASRPSREGERVLLDNGQVYFSVLETRSDGCWGYEMLVYLENNTDEELWFSLGETELNGMELDPGWSQALPAGTRAQEIIRWRAGDMLREGVSSVEEVDFRLFVSSLLGLDETEGSYKAGGRYTLLETA